MEKADIGQESVSTEESLQERACEQVIEPELVGGDAKADAARSRQGEGVGAAVQSVGDMP